MSESPTQESPAEAREPEGRRRLSIELSNNRIAHIDALKKEWGLRNRGDVLERLLDDLFAPPGDESEEEEEREDRASNAVDEGDDLDEEAALVLVGRGTLEQLDVEFDPGPTLPRERELHRSAPSSAGGGIDLPGFVRKNTRQLRRSLRTPSPGRPAPTPAVGPLPHLSAERVDEAIGVVREHWQGLYGKPANEAVLEAAMVWLAQDIWPSSDASEGRSFTWSAACRLMAELVPGWGDGPPSFERVVVTAGLLEDPFSGSTLSLRIPTLVRRFVQRFRRRRRGTSFQTLEHTMTLQGALRLLQLPTDPGQRLTLAQIREAYRQMALSHHPDSGGSEEAMRRVNEAYQLLKELYRQKERNP
ncbi:J domain-containing protein [Cyanobium sp. FGCU-52]|nr:J domain-containing protein [Cyanobium sp. FGCU52]